MFSPSGRAEAVGGFGDDRLRTFGDGLDAFGKNAFGVVVRVALMIAARDRSRIEVTLVS
jgi:hypothetical protein